MCGSKLGSPPKNLSVSIGKVNHQDSRAYFEERRAYTAEMYRSETNNQYKKPETMSKESILRLKNSRLQRQQQQLNLQSQSQSQEPQHPQPQSEIQSAPQQPTTFPSSQAAFRQPKLVPYPVPEQHTFVLNNNTDKKKGLRASNARVPYEQRPVCCEYPGCNRRYSNTHSRRQHYRRHHRTEKKTVEKASKPTKSATQQKKIIKTVQKGIQKEKENETLSSSSSALISPSSTPVTPKVEILEAIQLGDVSKVQELVYSNVECNVKDDRGWTPLHWAAATENTEIVSLLLNVAKVSPFSKSTTGKLALDLAQLKNNSHTIKLLEEAMNITPASSPVNSPTEPNHLSVAYLSSSSSSSSSNNSNGYTEEAAPSIGYDGYNNYTPPYSSPSLSPSSSSPEMNQSYNYSSQTSYTSPITYSSPTRYSSQNSYSQCSPHSYSYQSTSPVSPTTSYDAMNRTSRSPSHCAVVFEYSNPGNEQQNSYNNNYHSKRQEYEPSYSFEYYGRS
eukprot:Awhi_evm1s9616